MRSSTTHSHAQMCSVVNPNNYVQYESTFQNRIFQNRIRMSGALNHKFSYVLHDPMLCVYMSTVVSRSVIASCFGRFAHTQRAFDLRECQASGVRRGRSICDVYICGVGMSVCACLRMRESKCACVGIRSPVRRNVA